jgi:chlorite dismutase
MSNKIYKFTEKELREYTQKIVENTISNLDNVEIVEAQSIENKETQTIENEDEKQMEILVIHMEKMTERKEHIEKTLEELALEPKHIYISDGNPESFTQEILNKYFGGKLILSPKAENVTSCALKHLLAYEYIVGSNLEGALILEDDICLHDDFKKVFYKSIKEYHQNSHDKKNVLISYEDSPLMFVPRSKRKKTKCYMPPIDTAAQDATT